MIEPSPELIRRVIDLGYMVRVGNGYDYSHAFKASATDFVSEKRGLRTTVMLQRSLASFVTPTLLAYASEFKAEKDLELLSTIALFVLWHSRRGYEYRYWEDKDSANLLYTLFYLDHLIPDVVL